MYTTFLIYNYKNKAGLFILVLSIVFLRLLLISYPRPVQFKARVVEVKENYVIGKLASQKVLIYTDYDVSYDNVLTYTGDYAEIFTPHSKYNFQFDKYMLRNNVKYYIKAKNVKVISTRPTLRSFLFNKIKDHPDAKILNKIYFKINSEDLQLDILGMIASAGVIIRSLIIIIRKILSKFFYEKFVFRCEIFLYVVFMLVFRHYLFYLNIIFYLFLMKSKYNKADSVFISVIIVLLINPLYMFSLTFIINFLFRLSSCISLNKNFRFIEALVILIPLQLRLFYRTNIIQIIMYQYYKLIGVVVYLLGFIDLVFSSRLVYRFLKIFDFKIAHTTFTGQMNIFILLVWIFFGLLVLSRKAVVYKLALIGLLFINQNQLLFAPSLVYTQLYIGQGDCAILRYPFKRAVLFIDTGPPKGARAVVAYLDYYGVKDIHSIIISHDDLDHSGNKQYLIDNYKVKTVVEKPTVINFYKLKITSINLNMEDINENSLLTYFMINDYTYLSLGDASKRVEEMFIKNYPYVKPNIIKLGHHGSDTSTSRTLLELESVLLLLNSSGYNNMYNHPNHAVMQRILQYGLPFIDTQQVGDIEIRHIFGYNFLTY